MTQTGKKILFISHDASRTGAVISFIEILKWFKANSGIPFQILLKNGGPLKQEFEAIAPVTDFTSPPDHFFLLKRAAWHLGYRDEKNAYKSAYFRCLKKKLAAGNFSLIWSNTTTNGELLEFLSDLKCPVITNVCELDYIIRSFGPENIARVKKYTKHYFAISGAVKEYLVQTHGVKPQDVDVFYPFIPIDRHDTVPYFTKNGFYKDKLGIPEGAFVVGASGTRDWRKGPELFIQLAYAVHKRNPAVPVHFVWVGGEPGQTNFDGLLYDMKNARVEDRMHFVDSNPDTLDYFKNFDVFTMISREEAFGRVILEAALFGKPTLCFDNSGGPREFVENDSGFVLPYLDIEAMAEKIMLLLNSSELRERMGACAFQKIRERYASRVQGPKLLEALKRFL